MVVLLIIGINCFVIGLMLIPMMFNDLHVPSYSPNYPSKAKRNYKPWYKRIRKPFSFGFIISWVISFICLTTVFFS